MNKVEKRKVLIGFVILFTMSGALLGSNFIKLDTIFGETTLHEALSMILFPYLMLSKIFDLTNRFVDWLFEIAEE